MNTTYKMLYKVTGPSKTRIKHVSVKCDPEETCDSKDLAYALKESRKVVEQEKETNEKVEFKGYSIEE